MKRAVAPLLLCLAALPTAARPLFFDDVDNRAPVASSAAPDLENALRGVLLLVNLQGDGTATFGSGIALDDKGLVLTNLHVIAGGKSLEAIAYDPSKPSYAAIDGGLSRLLFEREKDAVPIRVVRGDPTLDLAVVQLEKLPPGIVPMRLAEAQPQIGDAVTALGHPEQNFWTVTRGQVSGIHNGLIQHDAPINRGNSGGPLLDKSGRVVGVNTMFLKEAHGIEYARPIALASKLVSAVRSPLLLRRDTPEAAVTSCARALELGAPALEECIDWPSHYAVFRRDVVDSLAPDNAMNAGEKPKAHAVDVIRRWLDDPGNEATFYAHYKPLVLAFLDEDDPHVAGKDADQLFAWLLDGTRGGRPPAKPPRPNAARTATPEELKKLSTVEPAERDTERALIKDAERARHRELESSALDTPRLDLTALRRILKMGLRVDRVVAVDDHHAWVAVAGRNIDEKPYTYSELLVKRADGWREAAPTPTELRALPKGLPPAVSFMGTTTALIDIGVTFIVPTYILADPKNGVSFDFAWEARWPALLEVLGGIGEVMRFQIELEN